jgi:hypothetical protein
MRALIIAVVFVLSGIAWAQSPPIFYSYTGSSGRTVYVNRFSMVPPEKRSSARAIDLSEVSLNEELAEQMSGAVEDELRHLKDSAPCVEARQEDEAGAWRHVWHRHGPWILASLAATILVLMTPWMVARTPPGVWSRMLMVALPALAMTALVAVSAMRASSSLEAVHELSKLCDANETETSPQKQVVRLGEMQGYIEQLYKEQFDRIDAITEVE